MHTGETTVDGVRSLYVESGDRDRDEAVVLIHGNPGSHEDWLDMVPVAAEASGGRAIAFDLPGFGRSDKPKDFDYTAEGYARWVDRALQELGIRRAHLILHDFGGPVGLQWAVAHADAFASLVLIDVGILRGWRGHRVARLSRTPLVGSVLWLITTESVLKRALERENPRPLPGVFLDRVGDEFDAGTKRAIKSMYKDLGRRERVERLHEQLRALEPPTLVLWGAKDPYVEVEWAERQKETFPGAEVKVFEDLGHWPFIDDPHAVADAISPFLHRHAAASTS